MYRVLVDKELRVHVDIEDKLEEVEAMMERSRSQGSGSASGLGPGLGLGLGPGGGGGRRETIRGPIDMPEDKDSGDEHGPMG